MLAQAAAWLSKQSFDDYGAVEAGGGGINAEFAEIVRDAAHLVADAAWRPAPLRRLRVHKQLRRLVARADAVGDEAVQDHLRHSRRYGVA